jgi:hypothetical protein
MPENIHPEFSNQLPSNSKYQTTLKIPETAFKGIKNNKSERNNIQHEAVFLDKYFIESFLNQWNRGGRESSHNN